MKDTELFALALGIVNPWYVSKVDFDEEKKRLDMYIDFKAGSVFKCTECGTESKVYDTAQKTWRHLNFFQYEAYLHARAPRTNCDKDGVKLANVPWARQQSGFTLLFEALVLALVKHMPVATLANHVGEHDTRIWRILEYYVEKEVAATDLSEVTKVGVDETAARRGHNYVTIAVDLDEKKAIFVTEGRDSSTIEAFSKDLIAKGGKPENITDVSIDMSPAFISGVGKHLPKAAITYDKFHIMKHLNDAVAAVWRQERSTSEFMKSSKMLWLKNRSNLKEHQSMMLDVLLKCNTKTGRAYRLKIAFQEIFTLPREHAEAAMTKWYKWAIRSRLSPMKEFARLLKRHWNGIMNWFKSGINNGILEGLNSLIQATKAKARGYRTFKNFRIMIFLVIGKLNLQPI